MIRHWSSFVALAVTLSLSPAFGQETTAERESVPEDTRLYNLGMALLKSSRLTEARVYFAQLIHTHPASRHAAAAFLAAANSYLTEGGTENLLRAEAQLKEFLRFYPNHELAGPAQLMIASTNLRKAEAELKGFLETYPDSELAPTAREFLEAVQQLLRSN